MKNTINPEEIHELVEALCKAETEHTEKTCIFAQKVRDRRMAGYRSQAAGLLVNSQDSGREKERECVRLESEIIDEVQAASVEAGVTQENLNRLSKKFQKIQKKYLKSEFAKKAEEAKKAEINEVNEVNA